MDFNDNFADKLLSTITIFFSNIIVTDIIDQFDIALGMGLDHSLELSGTIAYRTTVMVGL